MLNSPKDSALARRGRDHKRGKRGLKREKGKEEKKKEPSTIKTTSFSLSNLGSFQGRGKSGFHSGSPPHPPAVFHRKRILGRFQCAPRGRTMRPLKPRILASFCYPGAGEGGCAVGTQGPKRGPLVGEGLAYRVSPSRPGWGGIPAAKSQVRIRRWSRGTRRLSGSPIRGGEGRRRRGSNYGCSRRVARRWRRDGDTEPRAGRPRMLGPQLQPAGPQLPHCLLWSGPLPFPSPPSRPPARSCPPSY